MRPFLLHPRPGVSDDEIELAISQLPPPATAAFDHECNTIVVDWGATRTAATVNAGHRVLSTSGVFVTGPGSEQAVRRYVPPGGEPSWAAYDANGMWRGLCERCGWEIQATTEALLDSECDLHDDEAHPAR